MSNRGRNSTVSIFVVIILIAIFYFSSRGTSGSPAQSPGSGGQSNAPTSTVVPDNPSAPQQPNSPSQSGYPWGKQTRTSDCQAHDRLPDSTCTPGAILETDVSKICQPDYAKSVRNVTESEKLRVYEEYGIPNHTPGQYEIDHLVSLELGGSNDISNLWPELASPTPGFHQKDEVENYLHEQVCTGKIKLSDAQYQIATNWLAIYNTMQK